ncbi:interleukin-17 receptor B isoform X2 [Denticeps clupeoides]|uniref:interleukin-17 receptor B isoform X2 n=1 Tax=Denticeps clupeoides TaxID=299321 RepID=UPI0010A5A01B|nr:interleukin-17 receptor B-like isoform X2 [Denticeps clupeoides]
MEFLRRGTWPCPYLSMEFLRRGTWPCPYLGMEFLRRGTWPCPYLGMEFLRRGTWPCPYLSMEFLRRGTWPCPYLGMEFLRRGTWPCPYLGMEFLRRGSPCRAEYSERSPAVVKMLLVGLSTADEAGAPRLNISWALSVDNSLGILQGTCLEVGMPGKGIDNKYYTCSYRGLPTAGDMKQLWFHFMNVTAEPDAYYHVKTYNLPKPPLGSGISASKSEYFMTPDCGSSEMWMHPTCLRRGPKWEPNLSSVLMDTDIITTFSTSLNSSRYTLYLWMGSKNLHSEDVYSRNVQAVEEVVHKQKVPSSTPCEGLEITVLPYFSWCEPVCKSTPGMVTCPGTTRLPGTNGTVVMLQCAAILSFLFISCFIMYKLCLMKWHCLPKKGHILDSPPVTVLLVYPAVNMVFQNVVVALANFLQSCGSCNVTFDVWQCGHVAELGPLRWLNSQVKISDCVLIALPGHSQSTDVLSAQPLDSDQKAHIVPASAHELYPLLLNMLGGHAQQSKLKEKFCLVQLGQTLVKKSVPVELSGCRSCILMRDLEKLQNILSCSQLPMQTRSEKADCDKATAQLREAVKKLERWENHTWID